MRPGHFLETICPVPSVPERDCIGSTSRGPWHREPSICSLAVGGSLPWLLEELKTVPLGMRNQSHGPHSSLCPRSPWGLFPPKTDEVAFSPFHVSNLLPALVSPVCAPGCWLLGPGCLSPLPAGRWQRPAWGTRQQEMRRQAGKEGDEGRVRRPVFLASARCPSSRLSPL